MSASNIISVPPLFHPWGIATEAFKKELSSLGFTARTIQDLSGPNAHSMIYHIYNVQQAVSRARSNETSERLNRLTYQITKELEVYNRGYMRVFPIIRVIV